MKVTALGLHVTSVPSVQTINNNLKPGFPSQTTNKETNSWENTVADKSSVRLATSLIIMYCTAHTDTDSDANIAVSEPLHFLPAQNSPWNSRFTSNFSVHLSQNREPLVFFITRKLPHLSVTLDLRCGFVLTDDSEI